MILLAVLLASSAPTVGPIRLGQKGLNAISDRCKAPRKWLWSERGEIHIQPDQNAKIGQIDCVLRRLRRAHAGYLGFEGNERYQ